MALLLVVIIVGAVALLIALNAVLLGLGDLESGYTGHLSSQARSLTEGCVEQALVRLQYDPVYVGETLNIAQGNCILSVQAIGNDRIISATGTVQSQYSLVRVGATLGANFSIDITSWEEL